MDDNLPLFSSYFTDKSVLFVGVYGIYNSAVTDNCVKLNEEIEDGICIDYEKTNGDFLYYFLEMIFYFNNHGRR